MNVSFVASGALSRRHYKLVSDVENAASTQAADQAIWAEINHIQRRARSSDMSLQDWKESLVILLYCSMTISIALPPRTLDFALPPAVTLAEAGDNVSDNRIGYLFCTEVMAQGHELRLMLVNTLRKDLESPEIPRVCLALDGLIACPSQDVVPAVQPRLHDLLSHSSLHVRRRALFAFRALAEHDATLLERIQGDIRKRLHDTYPMVLNAALAVMTTGLQVRGSGVAHQSQASETTLQKDAYDTTVFRKIIHELFNSLLEASSRLAHGPLLQTLDVLRIIGSRATNASRPRFLIAYLLHGLTLNNSACFVHFLATLHNLYPVAQIRDCLTSREVNDHVFFLSCLDVMDPVLWAGTKPEVRPLVLEAWEVERVMGFLDSPDPLIRKKTLAILNKIDPGIVSTYYVQSVQSLPPDLPLPAKEAYVSRLLEVIETQCNEEGEAYAHMVLELLRKLSTLSPSSAGSPPTSAKSLVLENVVTAVLQHIRYGNDTFRVNCATTFIACVLNAEAESSLMPEASEDHGPNSSGYVEPTAMVITAALATEFCGQLAMPPASLLRGLSSRLDRCPSGVQDACLLAMLRISAECDIVSTDVLQALQTVSMNAGRHIRRRCEQFTTLSRQPTALRQVLQRAKSHSLPDFLEALQSTRIRTSSPVSQQRGSPVLTEKSLSESKLRYDAYETPHPVPRLRARRRSSGTSSVHSGASADVALHQDMSRTISPGQLAIMASLSDTNTVLDVCSLDSCLCCSSSDHLLQVRTHTAKPSASTVDLIAFDSPSNPPLNPPTGENDGEHEADFERLWNALDKATSARGWCEAELEEVVTRLRGLELPVHAVPEGSPPFPGEHKIIVGATGWDAGNSAVLRVRANDSDGCLWRMRCGDPGLQAKIKRLLSDA
ncbi:armadillo-type protein [Schizophyllum fasciatum]